MGPVEPSRPRLLIPYVVLGVSLLVTFAAAAYVGMAAEAKDHARFDTIVERTQSAIHQRIETYVNLLRGGAGLFAADPGVTRNQFHDYIERVALRERYPGIQGMGFSVRVPAERKDQFVAQMRREMRNFSIFPAEPRAEYHSIVYLEPVDERNRAAIGFDMFTEPTRRAAMEHARDSGRPAASGKVTLVQEIDEDRQAGFLIYVPIYAGPVTPATIAARRQALRGFIYAPFRADDLLAGIFGTRSSTGVEFVIYDGDSQKPDAVLHRSAAEFEPRSRPRFAKTIVPDIAGREWTIAYQSGPAFESSSSRGFALLVILGGGIISVVLFTLTVAQASAQRRAEAAADDLRRSETALRASESRFRRLADSNLIGVVFSTIDGRVLDGNDEYLRIVGRTRDELRAGTIRWDTMTPPEYALIDVRAVAQIRSNGICAPFEKEFLRPDGSRVPVLVGAAMLEGSDDETVAMYVDLTARKHAEQEIMRAKESAEQARGVAEQASRLKDDFLATVSHELRTPLGAILGWAQLLRGNNKPQDLEHGLATIERSAKSQAQLIDDLLDVSRIVAGKLRLEVRDVALTPVIEAALASARPAADAKGVRLDQSFDPDAVRVHGDPARLQQIVWNLLANAVKFTPKGGAVKIDLRCSDDHAQITVSDTGIGIAASFLPHVFERFRQADPSTTRRFGGLGLGLGIVRHLTELHGGTVRAESAGEEQGSTFTVTLPLARTSGETDPPLPPPPDVVSLQGVQILLVEDDDVARDLITRMLREHGAEVASVGSAAEAMEAMRSRRVDVLVSDIGMPDEDGYSLISRIRALDASAGGLVPAVALTALARPEDRRRAITVGFQVHMPKPVEPTELAATIANLARQEKA